MSELLYRRTWLASDLTSQFPPLFKNQNKKAVYRIAGDDYEGEITVSRWVTMALPEVIPPGSFWLQPGYFDYRPTEGATDWHQNFADAMLFGFYSGDLYAQDEMQVMEHPALGSISRSMAADGIHPLTEEDGLPTPVLVSGVQRKVVVDTTPSPERPKGLYGNRFGTASVDTVLSATRKIDPPTITNIVAITSLSPSWGHYTLEQIFRILETAYSGYKAAALASEGPVVIHTGFWGCGAFGGNRTLMVTLQVLAARLAGVGILLHYGDESGIMAIDQAREILELLPENTNDALIELSHMGFEWGVSDGN